MYLLNIFNDSKDNNHFTSILICSDTNLSFFFQKALIFKNSKHVFIPSSSLLYLRKNFINQNKNCIFMSRQDCCFCDLISQAAAILHNKFTNVYFIIEKKSLQFFVFIFFNFNSSFFRNTFIVMFHSAVTFQRYQIY